MAAAGSSTNSWTNSFWEFYSPIDTFFLGWCCPCILFGKTQSRLEDPSLSNYSPFNEHCLIWYGLSACGCACIAQTKKRRELRRKYGIQKSPDVEDSAFKDFCSVCCCPTCALVQEEKEVVHRQQNQNTAGYEKPQDMSYP